MAEVKAFVNSKGGVAKTTSVYSIAGELASRIPRKNGRILKGDKILAIDCDKQKNLSFCFFGADDETTFGERPRNTFYDFLAGEDEEVTAKALWQSRGNANHKYYGVDVMVADKRLADAMALMDIKGADDSEEEKAYLENLSRRFKRLVENGGYKYVLIDMPPSNKVLERIVFGALASNIVIPLSSDLFCVDGFNDIIEEIDEIRSANPYCKIDGAFFSRFYEHCGVDEYVRSELANNTKSLLRSHIPVATDIRETPMFHRPITYYKFASKSKTCVKNLVDELYGE